MNRRDFIRTVGCGAVALAVPGCNSVSGLSDGRNRQPNIILIMADDIGYECLGCYGSKSYKTPVLDELAGTGMRFEHCYSQPLCTPSRVKIMTGRSNARNYIKFGVLDFEEKTSAHVLKSAGYDTYIVGKWQLMGRGAAGPYDAGFDEYCLWHMEDAYSPKGSRYRDPKVIRNGQLIENLEGKYGPDVFCNHILELIDRHKSKESRPFFIYFPMVLTHAPFEPTPDTEEWKKTSAKAHKKHFADMVAYMDKIVGRIVQKLDELGLRENTLLLFTGDNGTPRGITSEMKDGSFIDGGKGLTTDAGTHVALIANWKGAILAGKVCPDLVDFSDILPTIAEASGASVGSEIDGRSFLPQLRGKRGNPRDWIFCWYRRNPGSTLYRFARDKRWKLYGDGKYNRAGNLYDVAADTLEQNPNPGGPEAAAAGKRLQAVLDRIIERADSS